MGTLSISMSSGPRLFLEAAQLTEGAQLPLDISLTREESHYLRDVLRLELGDPLEVGDRLTGIVCKARVTTLNRDNVTVTVSELLAQGELEQDQRQVIVLCALLKGDKSELVCDWSTELGCSQIHLWQSPRSVVRLKGEADCSARAARLSKIVTAAAQQSRRTKPPLVAVHLKLEAALKELAHLKDSHKFLCSLDDGVPLLSEKIRGVGIRDNVVLAVGPEGDIAPEEARLLVEQYGFTKVGLGRGVLRSELAVVTGVVMVR
jgi:16S rRNA (uracil1498-N3)-methyltransferase